MKKPKKPRTPKKPSRPTRHTDDFVRLGRRSAWCRTLTLAELVERTRQLAANKTGRKPEEIPLEELFIYDYSLTLAASKGKVNPKFDQQLKKYEEVKLPKYKKAMKRYKERMKVYKINRELYEAWQLKQREDELNNQLQKLKASLREVESERQALIDSKN